MKTKLIHLLPLTALLLFPVACEEDPDETGDTEGTSATDSSGDTEDTSGDTEGSEGFAFAEDAPGQYTRVDRNGMPAIGTAVIMSKDEYNQAGPADDAAGQFVDEITASVTAFHDALDDDLMAAGLVPCAPEDCVAQAAPLVVPDTIKIDPSMPAGFPNGRKLEDPVIDVTLGVVMLDLSVEGQDPGTLAGVPINPPENDVPFQTAFPYLAAPHE